MVVYTFRPPGRYVHHRHEQRVWGGGHPAIDRCRSDVDQPQGPPKRAPAGRWEVPLRTRAGGGPQGRLWRAVEYFTGWWGTGFCPLVISAPIDADLLRAESWTVSNRLAWGNWQPYGGWLEGNVVVAPEGRLLNILRVQKPRRGKGARVQVGDDGKTIRFDPARDFLDFPGGSHKFTIRYDDQSKRYWSLVNKEKDPPAVRNVLAWFPRPTWNTGLFDRSSCVIPTAAIMPGSISTGFSMAAI